MWYSNLFRYSECVNASDAAASSAAIEDLADLCCNLVFHANGACPSVTYQPKVDLCSVLSGAHDASEWQISVNALCEYDWQSWSTFARANSLVQLDLSSFWPKDWLQSWFVVHILLMSMQEFGAWTWTPWSTVVLELYCQDQPWHQLEVHLWLTFAMWCLVAMIGVVVLWCQNLFVSLWW